MSTFKHNGKFKGGLPEVALVKTRTGKPVLSTTVDFERHNAGRLRALAAEAHAAGRHDHKEMYSSLLRDAKAQGVRAGIPGHVYGPVPKQTLQTGPGGGKFYISSTGEKVYVK